jgi:hypothetical protein
VSSPSSSKATDDNAAADDPDYVDPTLADDYVDDDEVRARLRRQAGPPPDSLVCDGTGRDWGGGGAQATLVRGTCYDTQGGATETGTFASISLAFTFASFAFTSASFAFTRSKVVSVSFMSELGDVPLLVAAGNLDASAPGYELTCFLH